MKKVITIFIVLISLKLTAQQNNIDSFKVDSSFLKNNFPEGVIYIPDIVFKSINGLDLKLDIYRPVATGIQFPVLVSIHGGAWLSGTKTQDAFYSAKLWQKLIKNGYAIVSIEYRLSQQATFPAQIQDCNDAIEFIYQKGTKYQLNKERIAVMGGSAGGHLAELLGTSNEHNLPDFYSNKEKPTFKVKAVVTMFGVSDLIACRGNSGWIDHDDPNSAEAKLLGASPLNRPDLAKIASPTTYITKNTPPFLIFHGDKDPVVQYSQSILLQSYLNLAGVKNEFITVKGAGHGGVEFGADGYDEKIIKFLNDNLKNKNQ